MAAEQEDEQEDQHDGDHGDEREEQHHDDKQKQDLGGHRVTTGCRVGGAFGQGRSAKIRCRGHGGLGNPVPPHDRPAPAPVLRRVEMPFAACLCCFNFQKFRICLHSNSLQVLLPTIRITKFSDCLVLLTKVSLTFGICLRLLYFP